VDAAPAGRSGRRRRILLIASAAPFLGILAASFAAWWWPGELCSHWTLHGAFALLPAAIVWRRHRLLGPLAMAAIDIASYPPSRRRLPAASSTSATFADTSCAAASSSSVSRPHVIVPRASRETTRPLRPR